MVVAIALVGVLLLGGSDRSANALLLALSARWGTRCRSCATLALSLALRHGGVLLHGHSLVREASSLVVLGVLSPWGVGVSSVSVVLVVASALAVIGVRNHRLSIEILSAVVGRAVVGVDIVVCHARRRAVLKCLRCLRYPLPLSLGWGRSRGRDGAVRHRRGRDGRWLAIGWLLILRLKSRCVSV